MHDRGCFPKHFPDSHMFEAEEWDRIAGAAVMSREFEGNDYRYKGRKHPEERSRGRRR